MKSEQKWRPLYCMEKSRVQTKMAETYCYLEEQFVDDNLQVVKSGNFCLIVLVD
jgi:hypothetical protein